MGVACYYLNLTLFPHMNIHSTANNVAALIIVIVALTQIRMFYFLNRKFLSTLNLHGSLVVWQEWVG